MPKRTEIVPAKRRAMVLDHLRSAGAVSIQELSDAIHASESTIRRDLDHLEENGYLERTHGGAILLQQPGTTFEREPHLNAQLRRTQKVKIGTLATARIRNHDSVIFDSSSTVFETVRAAAARNLALTVITISLDIAQYASGVSNWRVIVPGGTVRKGTQLIAGEQAISFFSELHVDLLLVGCMAVWPGGASDASVEIAYVKRAMIASARRKILLADSSKLADPGLCRFSRLSDIDELITDDEADEDKIAELSAKGLKVTTTG